MSKTQILVAGQVFWAHDQIKELSNTYEILVTFIYFVTQLISIIEPNFSSFFSFFQHQTNKPLTSNSQAEFIADCKPEGKYGRVTAIYRHGCSAAKIGNFDKDVVDALPSSVKWIAHHGAGYDDVDIAACTARGIQVSHTPSAVDGELLYSAGLDVFPDEPHINPKLTGNDKITVLPHMGTETSESRLKMETMVIDNLKSALEKGTLVNQVWEQKK
ncbi:hypothetical protein T439DRAFT_350921 [Meredithblackwellia eburnea MCA 4105]